MSSLMDAVEIERVRSKARSVWLRSIKWHTFHGNPQPEGAIYLAHEDEVENIENLKFAVREAPPPRAVRA